MGCAREVVEGGTIGEELESAGRLDQVLVDPREEHVGRDIGYGRFDARREVIAVGVIRAVAYGYLLSCVVSGLDGEDGLYGEARLTIAWRERRVDTGERDLEVDGDEGCGCILALVGRVEEGPSVVGGAGADEAVGLVGRRGDLHGVLELAHR